MEVDACSAELAEMLESLTKAMTEALKRGDKLGVARFYADNALLTDLNTFGRQGRAAIDAHWISLPPCKDWRLEVLEIGGDSETPYQRLKSTLVLEMGGKEIHDVGYCFVVWKRQPDGVYRIYVDVYRPITESSIA